MDDKREVSEETRNGGAKAPFKFFHSSHQIVGSNPSDITAPTDKAVADFVNSSIATNSGRFQGTYETVGDLPLSGVRDNDYAFVVTVKPDGNPEYDRYKFSAQAGWMFEYRLNNSGFTAAQWAAITSGLSAADKARLDAMEDGAQENRIETVKVNGTAVEPVDKAVDIAVPTKTSDIENDSDFATNAGTVHKTGDETVMGVKTFGDSPVVPTVSQTSDSSGKAASTKWVGSKIAAWWDNLRKTAAVEFAQSVKAVGGFIGNLTGDVTGHASEDVPQTRKVAGHALTMDVELSASDVGALPDTTTHVSGDVPVTRKVNDYPLSTDITLTAADVKALPDTTVIPPAAKGSSHITVASDGTVSVKDVVVFEKSTKGDMTAVVIGARGTTSPNGRGSLHVGPSGATSGNYAMTQGMGCTASGDYAHAEGYATTASAIAAHAEGEATIASGAYSHAGGTYTQAKGANSHAIGARATANNTGTFVWNGQTDSSVIPGEYADHGAGTFNVNPSGGAAGFYIGSKKLSELIPTMPTVNNGTLTIKTGDTTKGTFTANQADGTTVSLAKVAGTGAYGDLTGLPRLFSGSVLDIGFKQYRDIASGAAQSIIAYDSDFPITYAEESDSWYAILRVYNQSTSSTTVTLDNFVSTADQWTCSLGAHEGKIFHLGDWSYVSGLGVSCCTVKSSSAKINIDALFILTP